MNGRTVLEVGDDGVAIITISNPPLNLLSVDVLLSLKGSIEEALQRDDVKAIVITGANGKFSGGFNVAAFGRSEMKKEERKIGYMSIEFMTDTLEAAKKPLVAAIDGPALGGGLEVALACHARISTSFAQLGSPELKYGILPGLGGTQRLPRLVGLAKALDMMLESRLVSGEEALRFGLVDAITPADELVKRACCWALDIFEYRKPWVLSLYKTEKLESLAEARVILKSARMQAENKAPNLKYPLVCIDVIEEGIVSGPHSGLWKEAEALCELRQSDTCRSLVHFFFSQRETLKVPGITDIGLVPRKINKVAIIGGGLMGSGIATVFILSNYHVILKEVNEDLLQAGISKVKANLQSHIRKGKISPGKLKKTLSLLTGVLNFDSFRDADVVIEAVYENLPLKQQIFGNLEKYCPPHCIFATNTSALDLNLIGERTRCRSRIVGAHFFSPAHVMPLLEIIRTEQTSPQVVVDLLSIGKKIRKTAIVVGNCTGFAVNRMFFPYYEAATLLVERGADFYQIDQAIMKFGMPMGPFRMTDLVGFGVAVATASQFSESFPERTHKSMLFPVMQEEGQGGESTLKGFYVYDDKRNARPDPEMVKYIKKYRNISDVKLMRLPDAEIVEMLLFPVVNEACRILAEGIAVKSSDLDVASVMGMGFPAYRGGIIFWADSIGSRYICSKLKDWSTSHGDLFKPCAYLAERASKGTSLFERTKSRL